MKNKDHNLLKMKTGEMIKIGEDIDVLRVYSGWIYSQYIVIHGKVQITSTFVPELLSIQ